MLAGTLLPGTLTVSKTLRAQGTSVFEVASVKQHKAGDRGALPQFLPGGKFSVAGLPPQIVIALAYNLPFQGRQLSGGPDWIRSTHDFYDIEAKADPDTLKDLTPEDQTSRMRLMLQSQLSERFKLSIHLETKEQPVYVLTAGKNGPGVQGSGGDIRNRQRRKAYRKLTNLPSVDD